MEKAEMTIKDLLKNRVRLSANQIALDGDMGQYTWDLLDELSDYLAVRMYVMGIQKGEHVGIWSVNTPNWIITFLALQKIGAIAVPINTCYKENEVANLLEYANIKYVYYGSGYKNNIFIDMIQSLQESGITQVKKWIPIGRDNKGNWMSEDSFVAAEKTKKAKKELDRQIDKINEDEVAVILFTSGTSSIPKGVMLTHKNLIKNAADAAKLMQWGRDDKVLLSVPLFHCFGLTTCLLTSLCVGTTLVVLEYYKTVKVIQHIRDYQCTVLNGVPSMFLALINNPAFDKKDLVTLKTGIIAGSTISRKEYLNITQNLPTLNLISSYGQTETAPCVTLTPITATEDAKRDLCGIPIPDVEVRIEDDKKIGEIQVKGYNVMKGYYQLPKETIQAFTQDGWLRTGDIGYLNEDGYLAITGRKKEMIIRAGENISPKEIEEVIIQLSAIQEVKVVGVPAEVVQEMIIACVITKPGKQITEKVIQDHVGSNLSHYKIPSYILAFEEYPLTASGKVNLYKLKEEVVEKLKKRNP